jgi:hypothetical protein
MQLPGTVEAYGRTRRAAGISTQKSILERIFELSQRLSESIGHIEDIHVKAADIYFYGDSNRR